MSKQQLKKFFETLDKEQIIAAVIEMYSARKEAKAYWDYYINPDCAKMLEKAKKGVRAAFYTRGENGHPRRRPRFKDGNAVVSDFKLLPPDSDSLAELMIYYFEQCADYMAESPWVRDSTAGSAVILWNRILDSVELTSPRLARLKRAVDKLKQTKPRTSKLFSLPLQSQ